MIVSFAVSNFKSFKSLQKLSLRATYLQKYKERLLKTRNIEILKYASIYGNTGSGKSCLIEALRDSISFITTGELDSDENCVFKCDPDHFYKPSCFEYVIEVGNKLFRYELSILLREKKIQSECLYELGIQKKEILLFKRDFKADSYYNDKKLLSQLSNETRKSFEIYYESFKNNQDKPFLTYIVDADKETLYKETSKLHILRNIFKSFNAISFILPDTKIIALTKMSFQSYKEKLSTTLSEFSTGIIDIHEYTRDKQDVLNQLTNETQKELEKQIKIHKSQNFRESSGFILKSTESLFFMEINKEGKEKYHEIRFINGIGNIFFTLSEQSEGTRRLIDLISILISETDNQVFIIDEIDRSLHPTSTKKFIKKFLILASEKDIQLVITTHETELMDLKEIRRDEINFIWKNSDGTSTIKSLWQMDVRGDKVIGPAYLAGDFDSLISKTDE